MSVKENKDQLRSDAKVIRDGLQSMLDFRAAEQVTRHGLQLLKGMARGTVIALYHPIGSEFDPRLLLSDLARRGFVTALPVVSDKDAPLTFRHFQPGDPLEKGPFGTVEPSKDAPLVTPSVLIVPLLAFDKDCYRLGWGGGYYDRTLAANTFMKAFGIAYAGQYVEDLPREDHDFPMHAIITETGIIMPNKDENKG